MTNSDVTRELPEGSRCLWQIKPRELPADLRPMALEMWRLPEGRLVLFQFFVDERTNATWYRDLEGVVRFEQVT